MGETEDDDFDDDDDIYDEDLSGDYRTEARHALQEWADILSTVPSGQDKQRLVEHLIPIFDQDAYALGPQSWEHAIQHVIQTAVEAKTLLERLDELKFSDRDPHKAGALLHLFSLCDDTKRFLRVGKNAIRHHPHLALPVGEKLVDMGQRAEAIRIVETALKQTPGSFDIPFEYGDTRESLLRFLVRTCDPEQEYPKLVEHAKVLLFQSGDVNDYTALRDLLKTPRERDRLIQQVISKGTPETVIDVLGREERWNDLLNYASNHTHSPAFPNMIRSLQPHLPDACFNLYRQVVRGLAASGTGQHLYRQVAFHARRMQAIPGHEEAFDSFMAELVDTYARRPSLISTLGDLAKLGKAWKAQQRQEGWQQLTPARLKAMDLNELAQYCPIDPAQARRNVPRFAEGQWSYAAQIWAILLKHGGTMAATDLTEAIAAHRNIRPQSAAAMRSSGLRVLEALGHVKIERDGNRLRQVRLLTPST